MGGFEREVKRIDTMVKKRVGDHEGLLTKAELADPPPRRFRSGGQVGFTNWPAALVSWCRARGSRTGMALRFPSSPGAWGHALYTGDRRTDSIRALGYGFAGASPTGNSEEATFLDSGGGLT